jgi:protein-S-isoprenylcysteine O-methyltransferase Ste14
MSTRIRTIARNIPVPGAQLLALALGAILHRLVPQRLPAPPIVSRIAGATLICVGSGVVAAAVASSRDVDLVHADRLVTTGAFARSRSPM